MKVYCASNYDILFWIYFSALKGSAYSAIPSSKITKIIKKVQKKLTA